MLDIHPQPKHSQVEVRIGERSVEVGRLDESTLISAILGARNILASAMVAKLFLKEEEREFEFFYHFDSVDEWTSYLVAESWADLVAAEPLIETTRELLSQGEGEILMRELARAARLKRLG